MYLINMLIFAALSILHFYWAAGGKWGATNSVPAKASGETLFMPSPLATFVVALGLLGLALVMLGNSGFFDFLIARKYLYYADIAIGALFIIRAIGDFLYVGFFKKVIGTVFAKYDTAFYSPLCLLLGLISIYLGITQSV